MTGHVAWAQPFEPEDLDFFERRVRPLLVERCYECHSSAQGKAEGNLLLDSRHALLQGGDSGPVVVIGKPDVSLLITAVRQTDKDLKMPPDQKLTPAQIDDLARWIARGLADPRLPAPSTKASTRSRSGMSLDEGRQFWSFRPLTAPTLPVVGDTAWPRTTIDPFILARLEAAGESPNPRADRRTLLRRVTFDLTGLPPTPEELASFLADDSPGAWERVVDRLLASPRYGERWGRHWLDVVRYADTSGNASDYPVPQAQRYRDWVISAIERDLPYDQFVREQLAGDLLPSNDWTQRTERVTATGYLAIARRFGGNRWGEHHLTIEDAIENLGRAFLGMSLACARCHDHKFDPFTMDDYYGLYGIFHSTRFPFPGAEASKLQEDFIPLEPAEQIEAKLQPYRARVTALDAEIQQLVKAENEAKQRGDDPTALAAATQALAEARKRRAALNAEEPPIVDAYAVAEAKPSHVRVHLRGDPKREGDEVPRHFPNILGGQLVDSADTTSGRAQLAEWIVDPRNPLTARVIVNRVWLHHFGRGLVPTPNDFGRQGQPPTHPELLDHLATWFIEHGWSLKALHREILFSSVWQTSSDVSDASTRFDPTNAWYGRFERRRLDAESIRDSLLFVAGVLDESRGGVHPFPPRHTWSYSQHKPFVAEYDSKQRSVYLMQQRLKKQRYLALFDGADPSSSTGARLLSTTPLQALFMLNDPLVHEGAQRLAARSAEPAARDESFTERAFLILFQRSPSVEERRDVAAFLEQYRREWGSGPDAQAEARAALARALLSTNEFIYID